MLTVRHREKVAIPEEEGVTVTIRGLTAAEQAHFASESLTGTAEGASLQACLVGVCGGDGFAIENDDGGVVNMPFADVTGAWLWENAPLAVAAEVGAAIIKLTGIDVKEKKE